MSAEQAPRAEVLASGLVDRDWVGAQTGRPFATDDQALDACLDPAAGCSPHPLYEDTWTGLPLTTYLADRQARETTSPHPLVDLARLTAEHPDAARDPHGPLSWWVRHAHEDTPVPVPEGVPEVSWGRVRAAALAAATRRRESRGPWGTHPLTRSPPTPSPEPPALPPAGADPLVTVLLSVRDDSLRLREAVDSVQDQTYAGWELVVVDDGFDDDTAAVLAGVAASDPRVVPVTIPRGSAAGARNAGLDKARSAYVAFLDTDHTWSPDFLRVVLGHLVAEDAPLAHAVVRLLRSDGEWFSAVEGGRDDLLAGKQLDLASVVVRRDLLTEVGGFDESLAAAEGLDLALRLAAQAPMRLVPRVLVERLHDVEDDPRWVATVLERELVDWEAARHRARVSGRVSIVLLVTPDLARTTRWVTRTMARRRLDADVELVVVGSQLPREVELPLATLLAAYPGASLVAARSGVGPTLCANLGIVETTGDVVVLARTTVDPPLQAFHVLAAAVRDGVAIAQPLVVDRLGLVVSAGAVFGPGRPHPEPFLAGHPTRDALALTSREVPAPLSPVVAVRAGELVRLQGFDVRVGDTMPEVELGLRVGAGGTGSTVVVPEEVVVIKPRQAPLHDAAAADLMALQRRWPTAPPDGLAPWSRAGFEVLGRRWEDSASAGNDPPGPLEPAPLSPRTVVRPVRADVREGLPALRWALDIAAPSGPRGLRWGDHHFARSLADALESRGQRVSVDTRDVRHRQSRDLDDVVLVLRGLDRVVPRPGRVNLEWVISHPDLVDREELAAFDRVYAASATWASHATTDLGVEVIPLLQCTDPQLFNPSRGRPDTGPAVLFVGNSRQVYRRSVRSAIAAGADVEVHGSDWEGFVPARLIASKAVANDRLGELYCSAGVVLSDHHEDMRRNGFLANRLFDVTACAARLVTDDIDGLAEVFGDVVQTFHDETAMRALLADPATAFPSYDARLALAEKVMREHSFDRRAELLIEDAARLRAR